MEWMEGREHCRQTTGINKYHTTTATAADTITHESARTGTVCLCGEAESGRVEDDAHEAARDDTGHGQGDEPTEVDPRDHAPVDRAPCTRAETDADRGTGDALRRRDGEC